MALLLAGYLGSLLVMNRLVVTVAGVAYWSGFLRKRSVESFGVGRSRSPMGYPAVAIMLGDGNVRVTYVASLTVSRPACIASELNALHHEYAPGPQPSGEQTEDAAS